MNVDAQPFQADCSSARDSFCSSAIILSRTRRARTAAASPVRSTGLSDQKSAIPNLLLCLQPGQNFVLRGLGQTCPAIYRCADGDTALAVEKLRQISPTVCRFELTVLPCYPTLLMASATALLLRESGCKNWMAQIQNIVSFKHIASPVPGKAFAKPGCTSRTSG